MVLACPLLHAADDSQQSLLLVTFSPQAERELEEDLVLGNSSHHWWHQVNKQPQVNVTRSQTRVVVLHSISPHGEIYTNGLQTDITYYNKLEIWRTMAALFSEGYFESK